MSEQQQADNAIPQNVFGDTPAKYYLGGKYYDGAMRELTPGEAASPLPAVAAPASAPAPAPSPAAPASEIETLRGTVDELRELVLRQSEQIAALQQPAPETREPTPAAQPAAPPPADPLVQLASGPQAAGTPTPDPAGEPQTAEEAMTPQQMRRDLEAMHTGSVIRIFKQAGGEASMTRGEGAKGRMIDWLIAQQNGGDQAAAG